MEPGADFEQAGQTASHLDAASRWPCDATQNLEQRALARSVPTDDSDDVAGVYIERHVAERAQDALPIVAIELIERAQSTEIAQGCRERRRQTNGEIL
jgi:hypothetical protein